MFDTESPTGNGLTQLFSKNRRKKGRDSASESLKSNETGSDGYNRVRDSLESVAEKLKIHRDQEENNDSNVPKLHAITSIGSKRRRKKEEKEEEQRIEEEAARGRSIADRGTLENESRSPMLRHDSGHSGDGGSSLMTYDSES
jgi:hypothetical protein